MSTRLSFWLLPAEEDRLIFEAIIARLAQAYDAPVFAPHVTLYAGEYADHEDPGAILQQAIQGMDSVELTVDSIRTTRAFTKTLFVQFAPSEPLNTFSDRIRQLSVTPSDYRLDAHLSLLYKHMPAADQQRAATGISLPQTQVSFDAVAGNVSPTPTRTRDDVERWELRWCMSLLN
ncbi:MAG TPA: cyclic phosphodiesterase-like protein [Candidatus Entotheonella sp.]